MRIVRVLSRCRAPVLAAAAVLGLGGCDGDSTGSRGLIGTWEAELGAPLQRVEYRLEITPARYVWTEFAYDPGGFAEDGLLYRDTRSGEWEVRGDRLALHAGSISHWTHPQGEPSVDYVSTWDTTDRIAGLNGGRLTLEHRPPPHHSSLRPTLEFRRTP